MNESGSVLDSSWDESNTQTLGTTLGQANIEMNLEGKYITIDATVLEEHLHHCDGVWCRRVNMGSLMVVLCKIC